MAVRLATVVLTLVLVIACGDSPSGPGAVSLDGTWAGNVSGLQINMTITETDGLVNGSAILTAFGDSFGMPVIGTLEGSTLKFNLGSGFDPMRFSGSVESRNRIRGTFTSPGVAGSSPLTLTRQE